MSRIFLLGGHDLEMMTIKEILIINNEEPLDNNLKWGAKLSEYSEDLKDLSPYDEIYAIELTDDIENKSDILKSKLKIIDHHNENSNKPSSIEQVCKILNIPLTREYQLIAINDSSYIDGMRDFGASEEEISSIRKKDRECQGVTENDEQLAESSIAENLTETKSQSLIVIESLTDKFSSICDKIYLDERYKDIKHLIIYDSNSLNYYGKKGKLIYEKYYHEYMGNIYCGNGYFGFSKGVLNESSIQDKIKEIKEYIINNPLFSYHTFMFPFEFAYGDENNKISLKEIFDKLEKSNWTPEKDFAINRASDDGIANYNEYNYFNEQARHIFYERECNKDDCKNAECKKSNQAHCFEKSESFYFTKSNTKTYKYNIFVKENLEYSLDINDISLRIFKHGIGILCFHLENSIYNSLEDILNINQYGRRIYPPFLSCDNDTKKLSCKTVELANSITIKIDTNNSVKTEFDSFDDTQTFDKKLGFIIKNLCQCFVEKPSNNREEIQINPILDDRMFVVCWYGNDELSSDLIHKSTLRSKYKYEYSDEWYEFLFIERVNTVTCQNDEMKEDLIKKSTYQRWTNYGTLYGISRYSFVCLTGSYPSLIRNNATFLVNHMRTLYYQMVILSFIQRISILRFKKRIENALENDDLDKFEKINKHYLHFINKICLREITTQEQGIEIYKIMRDSMQIDESAKALKEEIGELFNLSVYKETKRQEHQDEKLTTIMNAIAVIGGVFAISSLLANIMTLTDKNWWAYGAIVLFLILTLVLSVSVWNKINKEDSDINKIIKSPFIIFILVMLILLSILTFFVTSKQSTVNDNNNTNIIQPYENTTI